MKTVKCPRCNEPLVVGSADKMTCPTCAAVIRVKAKERIETFPVDTGALPALTRPAVDPARPNRLWLGIGAVCAIAVCAGSAYLTTVYFGRDAQPLAAAAPIIEVAQKPEPREARPPAPIMAPKVEEKEVGKAPAAKAPDPRVEDFKRAFLRFVEESNALLRYIEDGPELRPYTAKVNALNEILLRIPEPPAGFEWAMNIAKLLKKQFASNVELLRLGEYGLFIVRNEPDGSEVKRKAQDAYQSSLERLKRSAQEIKVELVKVEDELKYGKKPK